MKKKVSLLLCAFLLLLLALPAQAAEFDETYYRFNDFAGVVTEEQEKTLSEKAIGKIEELKTDFPVTVVDALPEDDDLIDYADRFYKKNQFGYGENLSGILLALDLNKKEFKIRYYGDAENISEEARSGLSALFIADCRDDTLSYYELFDRYYDNVFALAAAALPETVDKSDKADGMPYWYPDVTAGFRDFHGKNLPAVVDDAEIFTPEQIETLTQKILKMRSDYGVSYVAFTDDDNHGLLPEEYSSDFLHFHGYGVGDGYGAVVFYLSLDPEDRCWLTTSINSYEDIFTAGVTYDIDETVDADIRAGNYYEAFLKHADFCDALFQRLFVLPDWYPADYDPTAKEHPAVSMPDAPTALTRIVDNAGLFGDGETLRRCEEQLQILSEEYGCDLAVFTDDTVHTRSESDYALDFYRYSGYAKDGMLLMLIKTEDGVTWTEKKFWRCEEDYGKITFTRRVTLKPEEPDQSALLSKYTDTAGFLLRHGHLPVPPVEICILFAIGLLIGFRVGKRRLQKLKSTMILPAQASGAGYIRTGGIVIRNKTETLLYTSVSRTTKYKPKDDDTRSSSTPSRNGSTYTSGRSAGGSYSSGGRRF